MLCERCKSFQCTFNRLRVCVYPPRNHFVAEYSISTRLRHCLLLCWSSKQFGSVIHFLNVTKTRYILLFTKITFVDISFSFKISSRPFLFVAINKKFSKTLENHYKKFIQLQIPLHNYFKTAESCYPILIGVANIGMA